MSSEPRPVHVVVVSQDVSLLHEISWVLEAVGYEVQTTNDFGQDAHWRRYSLADFVIVDGRGIAEPSDTTLAHDSDNPHFRIFLYSSAQRPDFAAWWAAGAHDALHTPVSRGELLARMRTGTRYLEFERRTIVRSSQSMVPGILSRRGLVRRLRRIAASDGFSASRHLLLVTSIDWFAGIRHKNGETASRNLVITAAQAIKRTVEENAVSAYLGDGRFATLLVDQLPAAAKSVAEALANEFGSREGNSASIPLPTLTSAIVPWRAGDKVDQCLGEALETLDLALHSGGNCIVVHGEFNRELSAWRDEMATGNPFADVVAQDIMEPFPTFLERDTDQSEMAAALRRGGVPVWPYVDGDGRLVGVSVDEAAADEAPFAQAGNPGTVPLAMPDTIPYDASFPEIHEAFSSRGCSTLVVTADDHPLGYLTCDGFLSMIDPIHAESFAGTNKLVDELMYLVVPSKISEASVAELAGG